MKKLTQTLYISRLTHKIKAISRLVLTWRARLVNFYDVVTVHQNLHKEYPMSSKRATRSQMPEADVDLTPEEKETDMGIKAFNLESAPKRTRFEVVLLLPNNCSHVPNDFPGCKVINCDHLAAINVYKTQRKQMPRRLVELIRKSEDGRYHGGEIAVAKTTFDYIGSDGKAHREILLNGQHTGEIPRQTGRGEYATYKEFLCETPEQLVCAWGQFDAPGGNRTHAQIAAGYQEYLPDWPIVGMKNISSALAEIRYDRLPAEQKGGNRHLTHDERIMLIFEEDYHEAAQFVADLIYKHNGRQRHPHMDRLGVVQSCIVSYIEDYKKASNFWSQVRDGLGLVSGSHEYLLRQWLQTVAVGNTSGVKNGNRKKVVASSDIYEVCMRTWGHAVKGQKLDRIQVKRQRTKRVAAIAND